MPTLFSTPKMPTIPTPPPPVPMPVPTSGNNTASAAQQAQTIATTTAASGRQSTDLSTKGQSTTLGGN